MRLGLEQFTNFAICLSNPFEIQSEFLAGAALLPSSFIERLSSAARPPVAEGSGRSSW